MLTNHAGLYVVPDVAVSISPPVFPRLHACAGTCCNKHRTSIGCVTESRWRTACNRGQSRPTGRGGAWACVSPMSCLEFPMLPRLQLETPCHYRIVRHSAATTASCAGHNASAVAPSAAAAAPQARRETRDFIAAPSWLVAAMRAPAGSDLPGHCLDLPGPPWALLAARRKVWNHQCVLVQPDSFASPPGEPRAATTP
jgi:hypothetical protein